MDNIIGTSLIVSAIAMAVIFLVLTVLIFAIRLLVRFIPYEEPPRAAPKAKAAVAPVASAPSDQDEDIAVITSVMSSHLSKLSGNFQVINIQSR